MPCHSAPLTFDTTCKGYFWLNVLSSWFWWRHLDAALHSALSSAAHLRGLKGMCRTVCLPGRPRRLQVFAMVASAAAANLRSALSPHVGPLPRTGPAHHIPCREPRILPVRPGRRLTWNVAAPGAPFAHKRLPSGSGLDGVCRGPKLGRWAACHWSPCLSLYAVLAR